MRTTLNINDYIFNDLLQLTNTKTKTAAVKTALLEYLRMKRKEKIIAMRGTVDITAKWQEDRQLEINEYVEDQNE